MVLRPVYNSDNDKWVLNLYELERLLRQLDLQCAAAQDEAEINGLRLEMDKAEAEEQEKEDVQQPSGAVFSLFVNEAKRDNGKDA